MGKRQTDVKSYTRQSAREAMLSIEKCHCDDCSADEVFDMLAAPKKHYYEFPF